MLAGLMVVLLGFTALACVASCWSVRHPCALCVCPWGGAGISDACSLRLVGVPIISSRSHTALMAPRPAAAGAHRN